ncbi:hypothetical protein LguiA_031945 [Lonicera macranthoides]
MVEPDLTLIIKNLNPSLVIFDITMQWVGQLASSLNIPSTQLITSCATEGQGGGSEREDGASKYPKNFKSNIILVKTFREIEGEIIDYLSLLSKKKVVPVGPLIREFVHEEKREDITEWLNGKEPGEKIKTIDVLPDGFLEKIKERGLIVEGWAPQAMILSHASVAFEWKGGGGCWHGAAMEVMRDKNGKIAGEEVGKVIKQIMGSEKIGEDVRKKAREFMEKLKLNGKEEIDVAMEELLQLCGKH